MSQILLDNQTAPSTPSTGATTLYVDSGDKTLKSKDDTGAITNYGAPGLAITSLTGEVTATGPGAAPATMLNSAVTAKVLTGLTPAAGLITATDSILEAFGKLVNKQNNGVYPNLGSGNPIIASNTTLTSDVYYNSLTVNLGATLFTNGFRVFCKESIVNNGTIDRSGNDATGTAATAALAAGTLGGAGAGGAGGTAAGSAGGAATASLGGSAGIGGATGSAGGAAGAQTVVTAVQGGVEVFFDQDRARVGYTTTNVIVAGGAGGGGGAGDGTAGGAGGGGGGVLLLVARSITGTGTISAKGGNGFQPLAGNRGGGGAGGGGVIVTVSENDVTTTGLTFNVSGGTGASGSGTGGSGANGSNGRTYFILA